MSLLQYVDDLLLAVNDRESCMKGTENLLHTLGELGYRAVGPGSTSAPGVHLEDSFWSSS